MSTTTTNLGLVKPALTDAPDITAMNPNWDKLDQQISAHLADLVTDIDGVHGLKIEEGTFTPYIFGNSTAGVNTYATQLGRYYKIGKKVHIDIRIALSALDAGMAGSIYIGGLPFIAKSAQPYSLGAVSYSNITLPANYTQAYLRLIENTSTCPVGIEGSGQSLSFIDKSGLTNTSVIMASIEYLTD